MKRSHILLMLCLCIANPSYSQVNPTDQIVTGQALMMKVRRIIRETPLVFNFQMAGEADLNGDGIDEAISVSEITQRGNFVLQVGEQTIIGNMMDGEFIQGFAIVDIDTTDNKKEVAVYTPGTSADDMYDIFGYDGSSIFEMGKINRWPQFMGDRIVIVHNWMGTWLQTKKYFLTHERELKLVPQEFYFVGIETEVLGDLPILADRNSQQIVTTLKTNDKIVVLLCAPSDYWSENWFLIKSPNGLLGWVKALNMDNAGLPAAD